MAGPSRKVRASFPTRSLGAERLYEVYLRSDPTYTGRVTVPVLWDKQRNVIVSNELSEIIRMMNSAFDRVGASPGDFYPVELREEIDAFNARIYATVNNGVYKAGFATTQEAYEEAVRPLFATFDRLEDRLATNRYLCGDRLTEADWRLFTTLVRFDAVYVGHFKCNLRRIVDYPNLWDYTRELYQHPGVAATIDFTHIKRHYYQSHTSINPTRIVPVGPELDFLASARPRGPVHLAKIAGLPLILPSGQNILRRRLDLAFRRAHLSPGIIEVDSYQLLTDLIHQSRGYTIAPSCFVAPRREDQYCGYPSTICRPPWPLPSRKHAPARPPSRQSTNCCGST